MYHAQRTRSYDDAQCEGSIMIKETIRFLARSFEAVEGGTMHASRTTRALQM
jgi:hypothetical protein